jgi:ADP-ribose pyrophosphatase YjhB (NUDIX family)
MARVQNYTQGGYTSPANPFLDQETYAKVLPVWVKACIDAILYVVTKGGAEMVIGKRKILPQKDWWVFGGRILTTDGALQEALSRKLTEEVGIQVAASRIPEQPACINYMRWSDDGSAVVALAFPVAITEEELMEMMQKLSNSPEFEDIRVLPPEEIVASEEYHPVLRGCAQELMKHIGL